MKIDMHKVTTIAGTWTRAFIAAMIASYISGNTSVKALVAAGVAAVAPVILRYLNPNDAFPNKG